MTQKLSEIFILIFMGLVSLSPSLYAEIVTNAHVEVELISEVNAIQPDQPFWVALRMNMEEGWHTYWQNPGDSGFPTKIDWQLPDAFTAGPIQWPFPQRFLESSLATYGYEGEVFLLTRMDPVSSIEVGSPQEFKAKVRWLSCEKVCIPGRAELTLKLPVQSAVVPNEKWKAGFSIARKRLPLPESDWTIDILDGKRRITFQLTPPVNHTGDLKKVYFFPFKNDMIDHAAKQQWRKTSQGYQLTVPKSKLAGDISEVAGLLVSRTGWDQNHRPSLLINQPIQSKK